MVSGDEDVVDVSVDELLHDLDELSDGVVTGTEGISLRRLLLTGGVDLVVEDVEQLVRLDQVSRLSLAHAQKVFCLDSGPADSGEDRGAVAGAVTGGAVDLDSRPVGEGKSLVGQEGGHAQLGIGGQAGEHGGEGGREAVLLTDASAELLGNLVAQCVGDDHSDLVAFTQPISIHLRGEEGPG